MKNIFSTIVGVLYYNVWSTQLFGECRIRNIRPKCITCIQWWTDVEVFRVCICEERIPIFSILFFKFISKKKNNNNTSKGNIAIEKQKTTMFVREFGVELILELLAYHLIHSIIWIQLYYHKGWIQEKMDCYLNDLPYNNTFEKRGGKLIEK